MSIIEKIEALPGTSGLYLPGWKHAKGLITPAAEPTDITTDDLKALVVRLKEAEKKNTLWLYELNGFRDFSRSKEELSDKFEEWLNARLVEYDAALENTK